MHIHAFLENRSGNLNDWMQTDICGHSPEDFSQPEHLAPYLQTSWCPAKNRVVFKQVKKACWKTMRCWRLPHHQTLLPAFVAWVDLTALMLLSAGDFATHDK